MWPEIKGKVVYAPANHFGMNIPGLFYRCVVSDKNSFHCSHYSCHCIRVRILQYGFQSSIIEACIECFQSESGWKG